MVYIYYYIIWYIYTQYILIIIIHNCVDFIYKRLPIMYIKRRRSLAVIYIRYIYTIIVQYIYYIIDIISQKQILLIMCQE